MSQQLSQDASDGVPNECREHAEHLARVPGVVGVFFGTGQKKGEWCRHGALIAHVRWKHDSVQKLEQLQLPAEIGDCPVDVIEVGSPSVDSLDHVDPVWAANSRRSTTTALGQNASASYGLFSGHGTLPMVNGKIVTNYDVSRTDAFVEVRDNTGATYRGRLLRGRIGNASPFDFAVAEFDSSTPFETYHLAVGSKAPYRLRTSPLCTGDLVYQFSPLSGRRVAGRYRHRSAAPLEMRLPDGTVTTYNGVMVISSEPGMRFSEPGLSGCLVADANNRVVGAILGSSVRAGLAYVVGLEPTEMLLPGIFELFFTRS